MTPPAGSRPDGALPASSSSPHSAAALLPGWGWRPGSAGRFGARDLGLGRPPRPCAPLGHVPSPPDPCPGAPGRPLRPFALLPVGPELAVLAPAGLGPALGHSLGRRPQPRGLLACPGRGRGAGKTNRAGAEAGGRLAGGWKEVRSVEGEPNKALTGAPSPRGDPGPAPLSRGAPGPSLGAGRAAPPPHARPPGLRASGPPGLHLRPSPGSPWVSPAEPAARPKAPKVARAVAELHLRPQSQKREAGVCVWGGGSMPRSSVRKRGDSGAARATALPAAPEGLSGLPSGPPNSPRFLLPGEGPRQRRRREGTVANSCSSYIFHYTIR